MTNFADPALAQARGFASAALHDANSCLGNVSDPPALDLLYRCLLSAFENASVPAARCEAALGRALGHPPEDGLADQIQASPSAIDGLMHLATRFETLAHRISKLADRLDRLV